ncbi:MAG TPA: nitroreductase/quinone reductase family protein [Mycobacterium sp.]|nr:nitroreductase/quinone reductase family protein [Mycobacterium sp.]
MHGRLYRISGGRLGRRWFGAPVMVLETVGRHSGEKRSTPVLYLRDGDALVVMAANAGAAHTPAWWLNLKHAGEGAVVLGRKRIRVWPRELAGQERDRMWRAFVAMYPQAEYYPRFTDRPLPLIALEPTRP